MTREEILAVIESVRRWPKGVPGVRFMSNVEDASIRSLVKVTPEERAEYG